MVLTVSSAVASATSRFSTEVPYGRFDTRGPRSRSGAVACVAIVIFVGAAIGAGVVFGMRSGNNTSSDPSATDYDYSEPDKPYDPGYYPEFTDPPPTTEGPHPITPRPDKDGFISRGLYDKRDDYNFDIVNYPFLDSNIPEGPAYVFSGRYATVAGSMYDMMYRWTKPCYDFYKYACGQWMTSHPAEGYKSHDQFKQVTDNVHFTLSRELAKSSTGQTGAIQTAKRLFATCNDEYKINRLRGEPLGKFRDVFEINDVTTAMVRMAMHRHFPLAVLEVITDPKMSDKHILVLDQPSIPLRDLDSRLRGALRAYISEVKRLLTRDLNIDYSFFGDLDELVDTQQTIADMTTKKNDRPGIAGRYHKFTLGQLRVLYPGFDWKEYVQQMLARPEVNITVDDSEPILVYAPDYFRRISQYMLRTSKTKIIRFMRWNFIHGVMNKLSIEYKEAVNKLYSVAHLHYKEPTRWKTCVTIVDQLMKNVTGRLLVDADFDRGALHTVTEMVSDIRKVFAERIRQDNWMDKATTDKALEKLNAIKELVGYPPEIMNDTELNNQYQDVKIQDGAYFETMMRLFTRIQAQNLQKLRQPTNRHRWTDGATTVNAFYNPEKNIIVIPAGILRKPFYSASYPKSVIYASLGMIVAHEMTHGFDNKGSQFDKDGSLSDWWTPHSATLYREKEQCYKRQYSSYKVPGLYGTRVNGTKTLPENIADNGGVKDAFQAYTEWLSRNNKEDSLPGLGLNHNQVFYLAFAQRWCETRGDKAARLYNDKATHSPGAIRVKGTLHNSDHFAQTFNCPRGSPMNPTRRCKMW